MSTSSMTSDQAVPASCCRSCALGAMCLPQALDAAGVKHLERAIAHPTPLRVGDHLYRSGDPLRRLYIVKSGSIKVYVPTANGDEQILAFHLPGEIVGLDALAADCHTCDAVALDTTSVCELPWPMLDEPVRELRSLRGRLRQLMGRQLASVHEMLLLLGKKSAEGRVAAFLLSLSVRFKERGYSPHEFYLSMSRHDMANYLGLAVETVSRVLSRFHDDGLLKVHARHVQIYDSDRLQALVANGAGIVVPFGRGSRPRNARVVWSSNRTRTVVGNRVPA